MAMLPAGIRFNDCIFSEPVRWTGGALPRCAGLYVVLAEDRNWAPKPFQPLYFGEFGNNSPEGLIPQEAPPFLKGANGRILYVAILALPFSTTAQRWALCSELVRAYNPLSQSGEPQSPPTDLVRKLDELERKHHEQTAQLMWLRANAGHLFGPVPERRRRIGFQPESLPATT